MHISWAWPCTSEQPGNLGLALVGGAHQSVFNPVFCDGWGRVPPCRLAWGGPVLELAVPVAGYGPVQEWWWSPPRGLGPALLDSQDRSCQCPDPAAGPLWTHAFSRASQTFTGKSASVSCGVMVPISWILVCMWFCLCSPTVSVPQAYGSSAIKSGWTSNSQGIPIPFARSPGREVCCGA